MSSRRPTALEIIRDDSQFGLTNAVRSVSARDASEQSGEAYTIAALCHRRLAMCALFLEADARAFFVHLCHSAHARLALLEQVHAGRHAVAPELRCASKELAFVDALAAGQRGLATRIAELAAPQADLTLEYEDDFLLHRFMHLFVLEGAPRQHPKLEALLARWEVVIEGKADPYLDVMRALLAGDAVALADAFDALVTKRARTYDELARDGGPSDELRATEGALFMNGLAILRLAELAGLPRLGDYPTLPALARVAKDQLAPPAADWVRG
ncbi:MAG TPA: hypothetical protein VIU64_22100 [Polyangia bacterium]